MSRSSTFPRWLAAAALLSTGFLPVLTGCPGTLDDPSRFQIVSCDPLTMTCGSTTSTIPGGVTTGQVQASVFRTQCYQCHGIASPFGDLDLTGAPAVLEGRIVETVSTSALCAGSKLVVPGQPDRSLMYIKMIGTATCGGSMPLGVTAAPADSALVRQWILDLGTP